jgi:hypothetical protein
VAEQEGFGVVVELDFEMEVYYYIVSQNDDSNWQHYDFI